MVFRVGHSEVGAHGRMRVVSVVNRFQDIAGEHVDRLGFGVADLLRGGRTWVLHRMRLVFSRVPEPGEELKIRTWYRPERDLYSLRDFSMEDAHGEWVVFTESSWVVLDLKRGRPVRLSSAMPRSYKENRAEYFPTGFKEIPESEDHDIAVRFDVRLKTWISTAMSATPAISNGPGGDTREVLVQPGRRGQAFPDAATLQRGIVSQVKGGDPVFTSTGSGGVKRDLCGLEQMARKTGPFRSSHI